MLNLQGQSYRHCDGVTRRDALKIGSLAFGGMTALTLPEILKAEQQSGSSHKAIIMVYMCGAPGHQDLYDLKMEAPAEIRGEFKPVETSVPGLQICEHLPGLAGVADKIVPIRSMYGSPNGAHDSFICYTGKSHRNQPPGGWPAIGSVISKLQGPTSPSVPPFVGLAPDTGHPPYGSPGLPGFLGVGNSAFRPSGPSRDDMVLNGIDERRLQSRKELLASVDNIRREIDSSGAMEGLDTLNQQALDILTSSRLADALDLSQEPQEVRDRYGKGSPKNYGDGAPRNLEHFLMARRLVEAGARVVTLNFGRWDFHSNNFNGLRETHLPQFDQGLSALIEDIYARVVTLNFGRWDFHSNNFNGLRETHLPQFDQGLSALIEDLYARGMDQDVAVVAWGEFGRTPRINNNAGRDHWPQVGCGLLAGGGWKTGQVIGATDRLGAEIADRPVHFGEVFSSLYQHMGLDPHAIKLPDFSGRPQYIVDGHEALPELA